MSEKLLLIDGHSILFRAFFGMPISMTGPDGLHTNAIYGFLAILGKVLDEEKPDYLAVAFDLPVPTFRHKLYPAYKGTRSAAPDEFREQVPVMKELLAKMEIPVLSAEGWEADDILGTLAEKAGNMGIRTTIISGDRDLLQTAGPMTEVVIPKTRAGQTTYERYDPETVREVYGVTPEGFIELKALMGDSSDNVPGLPGVGPKTAQKIMETFGSIAGAREHLPEITPRKAMEAMRDHGDDLALSLELVTIRKDAPVEFCPASMKLGNIYSPAAYEEFKRLGFKSLLGRFESAPEAPSVSETDFRLNTGRDSFLAAVRKAADSGSAGIALAAERGVIYGAAVAFGDEVYGAAAGPGTDSGEGAESLAAGDIKDAFAELLASGAEISCVNAKDILKAVPAEDRGRLFDCVIAAYLLDPLKSDWSYDTVSTAFLKANVPTVQELFGKKGFAAAREEDGFAEKIAKVSAFAASVALRSAGILRGRLSETGMKKLFDDVEMPLAYILADMENTGILTSREQLAKYGESLNERIDELRDLIYEEAGEEFNINSPKQLGVVLFEKMNLKGGKKTKTGYSTAADVLEKLAPGNPIVTNILEYRTLTKLKSTYADGLAAYIDDDGRIRTTFNQTVTATGRLSSADPNLQNIPMREELGRMIRKCFYPAEGCLFVDADYSQIELRILAHMSGDEKLIEPYR